MCDPTEVGRVRLTCIDCGAEFPRTTKSKRCQPCIAKHAEMKKWSATKPWINCEVCGVSVPDYKGAKKRRFCSYPCMHAGQKGRSKGRNSSPWPHPKRPIASRIYLTQCKHCDRVVLHRQQQGAQRKWCGERCYNLAVGRMAPSVDIAITNCGRCGTLFTSIAVLAATFCSQKCAKGHRRAQRRHIKRAGSGGEKFSLREIAERDDWTCHLCGEAVPDKEWDGEIDCATLDHLVPVSLGGKHTKANVKLAHFMCNTLRSNKPLEVA